MYCSNCGKKQDETGNFCSSCGKSLAPFQKQQENPNAIQNHQEAATINAETLSTDELKMNSELDEDLLTFVDKNQDYYQRKWEQGNGKEKEISFNIAAFFLTFLWLGFRRMYLYVFIICLIFLGLDYIFYIVLDGITLSTDIDYYIGIALSVFLGLYGNHLYKKHSEKKVQKIKDIHGDSPVKEQVLQEKGGRRWYGPIFALLIFLLVYFVPAVLILDQHFTKEYPVEAVKYTEFYDYPGITVDELFHSTLENGEWELIEEDSEYNIIAFHGVQVDDGFEQDVSIHFYNEAGSSESEVLFVSIGQDELDVFESNAFLDGLFEEHEAIEEP